MRLWIRQICATMLPLAVSACTLHEYPDGEGFDPTSIELDVTVFLKLDLPETTQTLPDCADELFLHRFVIEAVRPDGYVDGRTVLYTPLNEENTISRTINMRLHAREYSMLAWSDYVSIVNHDDIYFDAGTLQPVQLVSTDTQADDLKDCFCTSHSIDLRDFAGKWNATVDLELELQRPVGRYELITTDLGAFRRDVERGDIKGSEFSATVLYTGYVARGFNVLANVPKNFSTQLRYTVPIDIYNNKAQMRLGMDYIFVPENGTDIHARIIISSEEGNAVRSGDVTIPIKRNANTVITGRFMSKTSEGGVSIDQNFDGEITIDLGKI